MTVLASWGERGSAPGKFNEPRGIAVDPDGNIYVLDCNNTRIQKLDPEEFPEAPGYVPNRHCLRPGDIDDARRRLSQRKGPDDLCVDVALPDDVDVAHAHVNRLLSVHLLTHIKQNPVAQVNGVVEAHKRDRIAVLATEVLEHPLSAQDGLRVIPIWPHGRGLG